MSAIRARRELRTLSMPLLVSLPAILQSSHKGVPEEPQAKPKDPEQGGLPYPIWQLHRYKH